MTTRDVYDRHTRHELDGDLDTMLSDYAPDAIVATPDGIGSGHHYIRQSYERVLPLLSSLELTSSIQVQGEVLYLTFRGQHDDRDELIGTDTFVIRAGLIHIHPFYATTPSPTDRLALVGALRSSAFAINDEDLVRHRAEAGSLSYRSTTQGPIAAELAVKQPAPEVVQKLMYRRLTSGERIEYRAKPRSFQA